MTVANVELYLARIRAELKPHLVEQDTHRIDLRAGRQLLAYAIRDAYGWALVARDPADKRRLRTFARVDPVLGLKPSADRGYARILLGRYGRQWAAEVMP